MRALAALFVVLGHAIWKGEQYSDGSLGWFTIGGAGVDLFFIISGFIMFYRGYTAPDRIPFFLVSRFF